MMKLSKRANANGGARITIHEDDAVNFKVTPIMKCKTLDESLHSTYGSQSESGSGHGDRGNIKFDKILIREYARTVGDNPSCSCGPPVR
jgi:hypothetical protein